MKPNKTKYSVLFCLESTMAKKVIPVSIKTMAKKVYYHLIIYHIFTVNVSIAPDETRS